MTIYDKAPADVGKILGRMMKAHHADLEKHGVTVDLLAALADPESDEPALKFHGYQCAAIVKVNAYKLRVQGHADAEIVIDGERWDEWSDAEKAAIIDHELEHLDLVVGKKGDVKLDKADRPKLRCKLHDHQFGWFDAIARRHKQHSIEVKQYEDFQLRRRQLWFDFDDDGYGGGERPASRGKAQQDSQADFKEEVKHALQDAGLSVKGSTITMKSTRKNPGRKAASSGK